MSDRPPRLHDLRARTRRQASRLGLRLGVVAAVALLAACGTTGGKKLSVSKFETFDSALHSRPFDADVPRSCEAARRALLSQGYVISAATGEFVNGRKSFQPTRDDHIEIDIRIVCARESDGGATTLVFVSGTEDRYTVRRTSNSASVGVPALGSVSLPFSSSEDSLVKVGSETIGSADFYERFYALIERYLTPEEAPVPQAQR